MTLTAMPADAPTDNPPELGRFCEIESDVDCAGAVMVSVRPSVVVTKTVCPPVVDSMSSDLIVVRLGEFVVDATAGAGVDVVAGVGLELVVGLGDPSSSSEEAVVVLESRVLEESSSSPPPRPELSSSDDESSCLLRRLAISSGRA